MNKIFAFFGFIVLLIITLLTGGVGLILLLLKSEAVRDFLAKAFADFVTSKMFGGDMSDEEVETFTEYLESEAAKKDESK
ncbi:membrane protein [Arthrobacter phage Zeina]|nr:membrane protein [Arthrobacter phage Zeina]